MEGIKNALDSGQLVVALMRRGHFTQQGHFIIITSYTADGSFRIADSNNYDNTKLNWDPSIIIRELNYRASNGGPLWRLLQLIEIATNYKRNEYQRYAY